MVSKTPPIHERLAIIRRQAGKTQQDAALATGIPKNSISLIEKGEQPARADRVAHLIRYYNETLIQEGREPYTTDNVLMDIEFRAH